ncbi:hypothetical protein EB796_005446 [Bugula neritina]|uniref:Uncharacterized protein n=1 Tax=Bugula neritina TaxID=10212 RepID=A0A7J7KF49_BUGNE|nr:hypothetical protein EB796_005446 [Bugula neritina]
MLELENSNEHNASINAAVNGKDDVEENASKNNVETSNLADDASVDENQVKRIDGQVEATLPCKAVGTAKVDVVTEDAQVSSDKVDNQNEIRERKEAEEQAISNSSERICLGLDISSLEDDQQLKQVSSPQKLQVLNNSVEVGGSCNINQSQNLSKEETTKLESESKCVVNPLNTQNEGSENQSPADQSELVIVRRSRRQASANALSKIVKMNQLENKPSLVAKFSQNLHTTDSQKSKSLNEVQPGPNVEQPSLFMSKQKSKLNASFGGCSNERTSRSHSTPCPSRSNFLKSNRTEQCSISPAVTPILKRGKTCNMLSALESSLSLSAQQNTRQKKNDAPISVSKDSALNAPINESIISIEHHINCKTNQLNDHSLVANKDLLKKSQTAPKASTTTKTLSELPWEKQRVFKRRSSSADSRAQRSTSLEANKKVDTNEEQRIATQRNSSAKLEMLVKENEATNQLQQAEKHVYLKQHSKRKCAKTIKHSKTDQQAENVQENNIKVIQQNSPIGSKKVVEQCEENAYKEGVAQNIENGKRACIKQSKVGSKKYVTHQKKPVVQNKTHQSTEFHEHGPATISKKRRDATFTVEKSLVESTKVGKWQENTIFVQIPSNQVGKLADSVYCTNGSGPSSSSSDNNSRNINQLENSLTNSAKKLADKPGLKRDNSLQKPVMDQSIVNTRNNSFRCALQEPSETSSKVATTSVASTPTEPNAISVQPDDFNSSLDIVYSEDSPSVKPDCLPTENNSAEIVCVPEHSTIKVMDKLENSMDPNISHSQHIESSQNVCEVKNAPIDLSVKRLPSALSFEGKAVASENEENEKTISSKLKNTSTIASDNEFPTKHKGSRKMIKCLPIKDDNSFFETLENSEHTIGKDVEQNSSNLASLDNTVNSKSKLSDQVKQTELAMSVSYQNACNAEHSNILLKSKALAAVAESSASSAHLESPSVSFISQKRLPSSRGSSFSISFLDAFQRSDSSLEETGSQDKLKTKQKEQLREEQQIETAVIVSSSNIKCHNLKSPTKPPNLTEDLSQFEKANSILEANFEHKPEAWTDKKPISRSPCVTGKNINYVNSNAASSDESFSVVSETQTPPEPNMCEVQAPTAVNSPLLIGSISDDKVDSFTGSSDKKLVTSPSSQTYETRSQLTGHNTKQIDDSPPIRVTRSRTKSLPIFSTLPTNQSAPDSKRKRTKSAFFAVESKKNIVDSVKMAPSKARVSFASSVMHNDLNTMTPCSRGNAILAMFDTPDVTIGKKSTKIKSILKSSASMTPGSNGPFNHSDDVTPVSLDVPSSDSVEIETAPSSEPKTSTMTVKQDIQVKAINNSTSLTQPTGMLTNIKLFQQSKVSCLLKIITYI